MTFRRSMHLGCRLGVAGLAAGLVACAAQVRAQDPEHGFATLVALSAARLELSRQVALAKWDTRQPVADPPGDPRELQVIEAAVHEAGTRGLPAALAGAFFADQIEASKLVQFTLIARWRREGGPPRGARADLRRELRPALDRLRPRLIAALVATTGLRSQSDCAVRLAQASASHAARHRLPLLYAIALDRGLARACGS